jgi:hypothetical protein
LEVTFFERFIRFCRPLPADAAPFRRKRRQRFWQRPVREFPLVPSADGVQEMRQDVFSRGGSLRREKSSKEETMTHNQQMIIQTWDNWEGERTYKKIAEVLNLKPKYVNDVIRNREEIEQSHWAPRKKRSIPCLRCGSPFESEGKYNRICELCRGYINKYQDLEETYSIGG